MTRAALRTLCTVGGLACRNRDDKFRIVKPSFVTWQLHRLHAELAGLDKKRGSSFRPDQLAGANAKSSGRELGRDRAARRTLLDRVLRSLPRRLGFRDPRSFAHAFARANCLLDTDTRARRRLTAAEVRDLERRVLNHESPAHIALAIGCAEQTVLNRASQFRKRLADQHECNGSGV
jgi:hypothetical protein